MVSGMVLPAIMRKQPRAILIASLTGWLLLLIIDRSLMLPVLCRSIDAAGFATSIDTLAALLTVNAPSALLSAWFAMLLAMMPLLLVQPLSHIWHRSLKRRRVRGIAWFVVGYLATWTLAGIGLIGIVAMVNAVERSSGIAAVALAGLLALAWQSTPLRQHAINRCHRRARLSAFGMAADWDCFVYGISHAIWCVGACWALMLIPLVAGAWHLAAMAAITIVLLLERARPAQPARWGFGLPLRAVAAFDRHRRRPFVLGSARIEESAA